MDLILMKDMVFFVNRIILIIRSINAAKKIDFIENSNFLDQDDLQGNCSVGDFWRFYIY